MKFGFKKRNIADLSLGEILQARRKEKNLNLEKIAREIKIDAKYLEALEEGEYQKLPEGVYAKSFLREYCHYLKLDYKDLLKLYLKEESAAKLSEKEKGVFERQRVSRRYFLALPKLTRNIILLLVIIFGFGYLGLRVQRIIAPPELEIYFPAENYVTESAKIEIYGRTEPESRVFINESETFSNEAGEFRQTIDLKWGINIIKIRAHKRYGRDAEVVRQVLVK